LGTENVLKGKLGKDKSEISGGIHKEVILIPNNPSDTVETAWNKWKSFYWKNTQMKYPGIKKDG